MDYYIGLFAACVVLVLAGPLFVSILVLIDVNSV